jgi:hypothetical protein
MAASAHTGIEGNRYDVTDPKAVAKLAQLAAVENRTKLFHDADGSAPTGFALRITPSGTKAWVLSYIAHGRQRRHTLGRYSEARGDAGLTPSVARKQAKDLINKIKRDGADPVAEKAAKRQAVQADIARRRQKAEGTLGLLLAAYVTHLKAAGKSSHSAVAGSFDRHVVAPFPRLAAMAADAIEERHIMPVLARLTGAGKYREAEKLKAYLSAAFTLARKAGKDATLAARFGSFPVHGNPVQDLTVTREEDRQDDDGGKWALSVPQLAAYWRRIEAMDTPQGALLRFHLLTGGQRVPQLTRLMVDAYDADAQTIRMLDRKGRRKKLRVHLVPLIPDALDAMQAMSDGGPYLFTVSNGRQGAVYHTVREAMLEVATAMVAAGEMDRTFSPGIIRKTVETRLAAAAVSKDVRAQLQSHGIGGVQDKHYDAHDYLPEKRAALETLRALCSAVPANVTPIRRKA